MTKQNWVELIVWMLVLLFAVGCIVTSVAAGILKLIVLWKLANG